MKSILGGALAAQGKYADAEPFLIEGFKSIDADPKAPKKRRVDALDRLIQMYESSGKPADAEPFRKMRGPRSDH